MRNLFFGGCSAGGACAQGVYALFRIAIGLGMALAHGKGKVMRPTEDGDGFNFGPPEGLVGMIKEKGLPSPEILAWAAGLSEFAGGILIALGLFTRLGATAMTITMAVAFFVIHQADDFATKEKAFVYLVCGVLIMAFGSGKFGTDALFRKKKSD